MPIIETETATPSRELPEQEEKSRFSQYITSLAVKPNQEPVLSDVPEKGVTARTSVQMQNTTSITSLASLKEQEHVTPELDAFTYMEMLLESLAAMGRLGAALDVIVQRVPVEIQQLIDTTTDEVAER